MSSKVVITGGGGFVGQWLAKALLQQGAMVTLAGRGGGPANAGILTAAERGATGWIRCDIRRMGDVRSLLNATNPDVIYHLAGISYVPDAEGAPEEAYDVNVVGAVRLLTAASQARSKGTADPLVLLVGSGMQYGSHAEAEMPLTEAAEQRPLNTYAVTKVAQEVAALQVFRTTGLRVICTRSFSHSGVGHDGVFLLPSLAARVRALDGNSGILKIGNNVVRDYLHVEDVAAAYVALVERGTPGEVYNVCSGVGVRVGEIARETLRRAGVEATIEAEATLKRPSDLEALVGSPARLMAATGWKPRRTLTDIIDDLLAATSEAHAK